MDDVIGEEGPGTLCDMFVAQSTPKCTGWAFVPDGKRGNPECFLKDVAGTISPAVHAPAVHALTAYAVMPFF